MALIKEVATAQFDTTSDKAMDWLGRLADSIENVASKVAERGREAQDVAGYMKSAVNKSITRSSEEVINAAFKGGAPCFKVRSMLQSRPQARSWPNAPLGRA